MGNAHSGSWMAAMCGKLMVATMNFPHKHAAPSSLERDRQTKCIFGLTEDDRIRRVPSRCGPAAV
jgi:hypothetical protein